ncbi:MAG: hypothetical protein Q7R35_08990 [Elusimicrobiota bacterium]|nr:hypothetical protein [Elusimicrobiota bacterium]
MLNKKMFSKTILVLSAALACIPLLSADALAIPAWARKYGVSCNVCHSAGYKLTKTGGKFLREGMQLPGVPAKEASLSDYLSIAAKVRTWGTNKVTQTLSTKVEATEARSSFEAHALSIYSGGPLDSGFSYFAEMYLHENEKKNPLESVETTASDMGDWGRSRLAEMYLTYTKPFGKAESEAFFTAKAGRLMACPLPGLGARLAYSRPLPLTTQANSENPYRAFNRQYGASAGLGYKGVFAEAGLVNGTGKHENSVEIGTDTYKDQFYNLEYGFGDLGSAVGVYYYNGRYRSDFSKPATYKSPDKFSQVGVFTDYTFDFAGIKGALIGAYVHGKNKYSTNAKADYKQRSEGYYAEVQSHLYGGKLAPYFRWDYFDPDLRFKNNEIAGPVIGLHYKAMEHGRFVFEYLKTEAKNASSNGAAVTAATTKTTSRSFTLEMQFIF